MEKEELKLEKLKSDFLSVVSHELRIPLATIKESISLISDGVTGPVNDKQIEVLSSIKKQIERLGGLVESLLDVSSIESGRFKIRRRKLELPELIKSLQTLFQATADKKSIKFCVELPRNLPSVIGDYDRVTQVFSNLLNNAFRFTPAGGTVTISCIPREEGFLDCCVTDSGVGIPDELIGKLFNKFEQLNIDESRRRGGAGLGLVISKKIVEDLGGKICVESKEGRGSKFTFSLPAFQEKLELELELDASIMQARHSKTNLALLKLTADLKGSELENLLSLINHAIRGPADKAVKFNDDIFVILLDTDKKGVLSVKERISQKIGQSSFADKRIIKTFGIAIYPDDALTCKELIEKVGQNQADF